MLNIYIGVDRNGRFSNLHVDENVTDINGKSIHPKVHASSLLNQFRTLEEIKLYAFDGKMKLKAVYKR